MVLEAEKMSLQNSSPTLYRVEVSGWDSSEWFFVENTALLWDEENGKRVLLRHPIRAGAMVFVRLINASASSHAFPVAYQAQSVSPPDSQGVCQISLVQLRPRFSTLVPQDHTLGEPKRRIFERGGRPSSPGDRTAVRNV